jgi:hypothetical protein
MNNRSERQAGISLIIFIILLVFTMMLHPAGGNIQHLIRMIPVIVITHSVAILALPFGCIGFLGLTRRIGIDHYGSVLGFVMVCFALIATLFAAATNGLILPLYLQHYKEADPEAITAINPIMRYGFTVNLAFDYIYTGAFCLAIFCWSVAMLITKKLAAWIGWLGIFLSLSTAIIFISGVAVNNLHGLRVFGLCVVSWILIVAYRMTWNRV